MIILYLKKSIYLLLFLHILGFGLRLDAKTPRRRWPVCRALYLPRNESSPCFQGGQVLITHLYPFFLTTPRVPPSGVLPSFLPYILTRKPPSPSGHSKLGLYSQLLYRLQIPTPRFATNRISSIVLRMTIALEENLVDNFRQWGTYFFSAYYV